MINTSQHIPFDKLADLAERREEADERREKAHLSTCTECASELEQLENVLLLMKTDREPDAPRDLIAYAVNIFGRSRELVAPSLLRRLVAALIFDSRANLSPAFGTRSSVAGSRQLIYSVAGNEVDVRITPRQDQWVFAGQVLGQNCAGGEVKLEGEETSAIAVLTELCEFTLPPVPPGSYKLLLCLADIEVELPQIEIRT